MLRPVKLYIVRDSTTEWSRKPRTLLLVFVASFCVEAQHVETNSFLYSGLSIGQPACAAAHRCSKPQEEEGTNNN